MLDKPVAVAFGLNVNAPLWVRSIPRSKDGFRELVIHDTNGVDLVLLTIDESGEYTLVARYMDEPWTPHPIQGKSLHE